MRSVSSPMAESMMIAGPSGPRQLAADRQAVFARQHHVQHHEVDGAAGQGAVHLLAVGGGLDVIAVALQELRHDVADAGIVVDDQDLFDRLGSDCGHFRCRLHAPEALRPLWRTNVAIATTT